MDLGDGCKLAEIYFFNLLYFTLFLYFWSMNPFVKSAVVILPFNFLVGIEHCHEMSFGEQQSILL